jgi:outer membrane receptor protein involved in Fe transport
VIKALDVELEWIAPAGALGSFRLYGRGTWQPPLKRRVSQSEPWFEDGDDIDGPLVVRGHGGVEWTQGTTTIGVNAQFFSSYRAAYGVSVSESGSNAEIRRFQGRDRIPSQAYFDLSVRHRLSSALELSAGVINLFDNSPPIVAERFNLFGYSFYGDARRRRVAITLEANL